MLALTRRHSPDPPDECWHVYYGDVRVGTIAIRTGIPPHEDPWGWNCGFYPGSHPGECTDGTAPTFDQARVEFEDPLRVFLANGACFWPIEPTLIFRNGATSGILRQRNIDASIEASGCRRTGAQVSERGWKRLFDEPIPLRPAGSGPRDIRN